jgi:hypothetical protein
MPGKDEITTLAIEVFSEFLVASKMDCDEGYFRFYSAESSHSSFEFMCRKGRELSPMRAIGKYTNLLRPLMQALFDELPGERNVRPLVAVMRLDLSGNYNIKFDYSDPLAHEIGYLGLGKKNSYFSNEVDIPQDVLDYQRQLASKGITETPILTGFQKA